METEIESSKLIEEESAELIQSTEENEGDSEPKVVRELNMRPGAVKLRTWLNKMLRIEMSDGRVLIGVFLCTDRDANIILGSCTEYLPEEIDKTPSEEPRMLGLVMIPGKHIVSISIDHEEMSASENTLKSPLSETASTEEVI